VQVETFDYSIEPTATPRTIDMLPQEEKGRRYSFLGIYKVEGKRLKLCRSRGARPSSLDVQDVHRGQILYVLERTKQ